MAKKVFTDESLNTLVQEIKSYTDEAVSTKADDDHTHTVDSALSSTSTNPVQNKIVNSALSKKVPTSRTINGKSLSDNISLSAGDVGADASGSAANALSEAKTYTDSKAIIIQMITLEADD